MRTRLFCAVALLCGAGLAHAQGFASMPATSAGGYYGPNASSPEYAAYANAAAAAAAMPGYAGGYPGASVGYPAMNAGYQMPAYGWYGGGYPAGMPLMPAQATEPAGPAPGVVGTIPGAPDLAAGVPLMPEGMAYEGGTAEVFKPNACRFWLNADYTMNWIRPQRLNNPLLTVGSTADAAPGALGQPGTTLVFGDSVDYNRIDGGRVELGVFLDESRRFSLEGVAQFFRDASVGFAINSDPFGSPVITRPVFNVAVGEERAFANALPNQFVGGGAIDARVSLFSSDVNVGYHLCVSPGWTHTTLFGLRYMRLSETLSVNDRIEPLIPNFLTFGGAFNFVDVGEMVIDRDRFQTTNSFFGGQIGFRSRFEGNWMFLSTYGKMAIGANQQTVEINGSTTLVRADGTTATLPGGILALPSNIGRRSRTVLSFAPEAGFSVGVRLTQHLALSAGYSFLFWNNVVRPGRQIDSAVDPSLIPTDLNYGAATGTGGRPAFTFNNENVWLHTLSLGVAVQY